MKINFRARNAELAVARELLNNHESWSDFYSGLNRVVADPAQWGIYYTSNRDSGLLAIDNEKQIFKRLEAVDPDGNHWEKYSASHWLVGYVDGVIIRPYYPGTKRGAVKQLTPAFKEFFEILRDLDNYPILDEDSYSNAEYEATYENVLSKLNYVIRSNGFTFNPDDVIYDLMRWLYDNAKHKLENIDDHGGYADSDEILAGLNALNTVKLCPHCEENYLTNNAVCDDCLDAGVNPYDYMPINDPSRYDSTLL